MRGPSQSAEARSRLATAQRSEARTQFAFRAGDSRWPHSCETAFLDGGLRGASIKAAKDCIIAVLSTDALALLNSQNSLVGYQLMKNISMPLRLPHLLVHGCGSCRLR